MIRWGATAFVALFAITVHAQEWRHLSTVHDGSGVMSDNTVELDGVAYRHVSAGGQPGGVFSSAGGDMVNNAGFLQAVDIKRPDQDTDSDGVIDELDLDNDGDGLHDLTEVEGSAFDPTTPTLVNVADTDEDGVSDHDESLAETNPRDREAFLRITSIRNESDEVVLNWTARGGKQYRVLSADDSHTYPFPNVEDTVTAEGGDAPWFETTGRFTNETPVEVKTYGVEVVVP
jgi:hypothetical protein